MNLFLVESPFQLMCALEAKEEFKEKNNILIIRETGEKKNKEQMSKILKNVSWSQVVMVRHVRYIQFLVIILLFIVKFRKIPINNLFIGEFRSDWMWLFINNMKLKNFYLLDDGSHTIDVQNNSLKNLFLVNKHLNKAKLFLVKMFFLDSFQRKLINLYTIYDFDKLYKNQLIKKNNFSFFSYLMKEKNIKEQRGFVYFIGSNMVENGMMEEEYFFLAMKKIKIYYENKGLELIYVPHRREKNQKLETLDLRIDVFQLPIELEFLAKNIRPTHIASFASTALYTLKILYKIKKVDSFLIDYQYLKEEYHLKFKSIYKYHQNYMNIIELS